MQDKINLKKETVLKNYVEKKLSFKKRKDFFNTIYYIIFRQAQLSIFLEMK